MGVDTTLQPAYFSDRINEAGLTSTLSVHKFMKQVHDSTSDRFDKLSESLEENINEITCMGKDIFGMLEQAKQYHLKLNTFKNVGDMFLDIIEMFETLYNKVESKISINKDISSKRINALDDTCLASAKNVNTLMKQMCKSFNDNVDELLKSPEDNIDAIICINNHVFGMLRQAKLYNSNLDTFTNVGNMFSDTVEMFQALHNKIESKMIPQLQLELELVDKH